jgi:hypothetical protein
VRPRLIFTPLAVFVVLSQTLPVVGQDRSAAKPTDISGVWTFAFDKEHSNRTLPPPLSASDCTFKQDGKHLTGSCGSDAVPLMGAVNGQRVTLRMESGDTDRRTAEATLTAVLNPQGTTMTGRWSVRNADGAFTATRQ